MKKILFIFLILLYGCTKPELPTPAPPVEKIFDVGESSVTNGQSLYFDLPSSGVYILSLIDKETNQVISREKFVGQIGENSRKIYTNSIKSQTLYLLLSDSSKNEMKRTTILIRK